jgi:type IV secretory pathway VirB10-like protein
MRKLAITCLTLSAIASPALAGQWVIEESDESYFVEYNNSVADKSADKPADKALKPPTAPPEPPPPAAPTSRADAVPPQVRPSDENRESAERPQRSRDQNRRERASRQNTSD